MMSWHLIETYRATGGDLDALTRATCRNWKTCASRVLATVLMPPKLHAHRAGPSGVLATFSEVRVRPSPEQDASKVSSTRLVGAALQSSWARPPHAVTAGTVMLGCFERYRVASVPCVLRPS